MFKAIYLTGTIVGDKAGTTESFVDKMAKTSQKSNLNTKHWKRRYILVVFNVVYKSGRRGNSWILDVGAKNGREEKRRICISRNRR